MKSRKLQQPNAGEIVYRDMAASAAILDESARRVRLSFSSEAEIRRDPFFGDPFIEILGHNAGEVDLARFNNGATVHYNHQRTRLDRIGGVEKAWVEKGRGIAIIRLSKRDDIADVWTDLRDGILTNVSVGYKIHETEPLGKNSDGVEVFRVTNWEPVEISLVDIPADPTVGVGRSIDPGSASRTSADQTGSLSTRSTGEPKMTEAERKQLIEEGRRAEAQRVAEIRQAFQFAADTPETRALQGRCIDDANCTIDQARKLLLEEIGRGKSASGPAHGDAYSYFETSGDGRISTVPNTFRQEAVDGLLLRCGVKVENPSVYARDVSHMSLMDIARACLSQSGGSASGKSAARFLAGAMTSSDFPNLLANLGEKLIINGFNQPEETSHRIWTAEASHRDFKPTGHVAVSETPGLRLIGVGGEYTYGVLSDTGDTVTLATYGRILAFARQAIINDDLQMISDSLTTFGYSAARLEKDLCYAILTTNPDMSDGTALFHTDHANIGTGGAPSVTTLGEARKLMRQQMGLNGEEFLDPKPFALIVPTALETSCEQLLTSLYDPAGVNQQTNTPEFVRRLQLIAEPRLDAHSTTEWYLTANPNSFGWVKRIYLDGQTTPYTDEEVAWTSDQLEFKCRHDVAVNAFLYQGAVRNAGS